MHVIRVSRSDKEAFCEFLNARAIPFTIFSVSVQWTQYCVQADDDALLMIGLSFNCMVHSRDRFIEEYSWSPAAIADTPLAEE